MTFLKKANSRNQLSFQIIELPKEKLKKEHIQKTCMKTLHILNFKLLLNRMNSKNISKSVPKLARNCPFKLTAAHLTMTERRNRKPYALTS